MGGLWPVSLHPWHPQQAQHTDHNMHVLWPHGWLHGTLVPGMLDHTPAGNSGPVLGRQYLWPGLRTCQVRVGPGLRQPAWALLQLRGEVL